MNAPAAAPKAPSMPRRPSPIADAKLLAEAARDAATWAQRLREGKTERDRSRPVIARDTGAAEIPTSSLPEAVRARIEGLLYSDSEGEP